MTPARPVAAMALAAVLATGIGVAEAPPAEATGATGATGAVARLAGRGDEGQPTEQQVRDARARADRLRAVVARESADATSAAAALEAAATESALALEAYRAAAETQRDAVAELARREDALASADAAARAARAGLGRWARSVYEDGGTLAASPGVDLLLSGGDTDGVAVHQQWLRLAGRDRARAVAELDAALAGRQEATDRAQHAAELATATAAQAEAARAARDAVLEAHRRRIADLQVALSGARNAVDAADRSVADLAAARLSAGAYPGGAAFGAGFGAVLGAGGNRVTGPVGDCAGGDVSAYGNGRIPLSALCPLDGPSGGLLRADAAYAFNRLMVAYERRFGRPICVTDSYRSYADQVRVRAARPGLAAVPGRSNHGWGTATDLCGGIERFDTVEHTWMRLNAPLFGWFDPAWARRGGTLPEAWHWEFSG